ncbi:PAS domain-containing sensor histidine kinase [Roseospirillum parvum]|uniref:histidine kinase n=1 Tax=Roseospirillum parvum TaxID=83401 RepID=A0A1G8AR45_9PROT|nr:PAS domain-containing sensor histidine kinase [Roseospirillum parvum]SDH23344.1 PAS domain S-box-containing protein [Roseospirillum parvum]
MPTDFQDPRHPSAGQPDGPGRADPDTRSDPTAGAEGQAAEDRLTRMAALLPGVLYQYRLWPDGRSAFPFATEGLRDIYGLHPTAVRDSALPVAEVLHPDDIDRIMETILQSARTLTTWHQRYRVNHPRRGLIHVEGRAQPELLSDDSVLWHGLILDITEQVRQEEELDRLERRHRMVARNLNLGTWELDPKAGRLEVDEQFFTMLGHPPGRRRLDYDAWLDLLHPDDAATQWQDMSRQIANDGAFTIELRHRTAEGGWLWVEVRGAVVEWRDERPRRLIGTSTDISGRKAAEQALRDSEREKRLVLSSITDVISYYTGPDLRITWTNLALANHAELDPGTLVGRICHDIWFGSDRPCQSCPVVETFRTGQETHGEQTTPDDRHWALSAFPMRDEAGQMLGVVEVARDVSDQVEARRALAQAVADLERAQRIAAIGNWSVDPASGKTTWSDQVYRILGQDPEGPPLSVETSATVFAPADHARLTEAIGAAIRDGTPYAITLQLSLPDRPLGWVRAIGEPEADPGPAGHVVHGTIQDITHIKQTEAALTRSEEKLRLALEVAEDGIWDLDLASGTVEWTPRLYTLLGYPPDSFPATFETWREMVHPEDLPKVEAEIYKALTSSSGIKIEYRMRHRDGRWLWIWDHARPVAWNANGSVARLLGVATDIDARKRWELAQQEARQQAEQGSQAKSRFLATMSHELRTPLNSILGFSEMMEKGILGPLENPTYRQYAADIHRSGHHLVELIDGLMDLAKIEAGRRELAPHQQDVAELVRAVVHLLAQRASEAGLALDVHLDPTLPPLIADGLAVRQVLVNLLSNAIKFTPPGGRIDISAQADPEGGVVIQVRDTGIGISAADQARLFQPFSRAAEAEKRHIEGSGLGLALVHALMDLHGGTVGVDSTPGQGSTFTVRFPAA